MSDYGVVSTGFNKKRLQDILAETEADIRAIPSFGENFNMQPESPMGQLNGIYSEGLALAWEQLENVYNSFSPSKSVEASLSDLVQINSIRRKGEEKSTVTLTLTGTSGTVVPAGNLFSTSAGDQFSLLNSTTIPASGSIDSQAEAVIAGEVIALANTITQIDNAVTGLNSVTNAVDAVAGRGVEEDPALRARRVRSVAIASVSLLDGVEARLLALENVTQVKVRHNPTDAQVGDLPSRSINAVVVGGDDNEIATTLELTHTVGAEFFGNSSGNYIDSEGVTKVIAFSRPTEIPIYVIINITTLSSYPTDGDDRIKQAIVDYATGQLVTGRDFNLADDVIHNQIYTPINTVEGHTVNDLFIGTSANPSSSADIAIADSEAASFTTANITINHV